jgi:hypothetical protein
VPIKAKWHPFKDNVVDLAPEHAGVYELGYGETVVYIGSAVTSIQDRLRSHKKMKKFMKVTQFRFKRTTSEDARSVEAKLCKDFMKAHKGNLPRLQERAPKVQKPFWPF